MVVVLHEYSVWCKCCVLSRQNRDRDQGRIVNTVNCLVGGKEEKIWENKDRGLNYKGQEKRLAGISGVMHLFKSFKLEHSNCQKKVSCCCTSYLHFHTKPLGGNHRRISRLLLWMQLQGNSKYGHSILEGQSHVTFFKPRGM